MKQHCLFGSNSKLLSVFQNVHTNIGLLKLNIYIKKCFAGDGQYTDLQPTFFPPEIFTHR